MILDPFEPGTVNRMLNCLGGITPELVEEMAPDESLSVVEGECLQLGGGGVVYDSMAVLPQKGDYPHSTMYQCSSGLNTPHMLQVRLKQKKFSGFKTQAIFLLSLHVRYTRDLAKEGWTTPLSRQIIFDVV